MQGTSLPRCTSPWEDGTEPQGRGNEARFAQQRCLRAAIQDSTSPRLPQKGGHVQHLHRTGQQSSVQHLPSHIAAPCLSLSPTFIFVTSKPFVFLLRNVIYFPGRGN